LKIWAFARAFIDRRILLWGLAPLLARIKRRKWLLQQPLRCLDHEPGALLPERPPV
jgi:hypothetical protein